MLSPSVQTGSGSVPLQFFAMTSTPPFIDGPKPVLWFGAASVLFFFILILFLIIRWRVILPARHKTIDKHIFEPAGSDADITFDDSESLPPKESIAAPEHSEQAPSGHEPSFDDDTTEAEIEPLEFPAPEKTKKKRNAFAGLFSKKQKKNIEPADDPEMDQQETFVETEELAVENGFRFGARDIAPEPDPLDYPSEELLQNQDDEIESRRRDAERREQALLHEQQQLEHDRAEQDQKVRTLTEQSNAMFARERQVASLEERFSNLSTDLHERLEQTALSLKTLQEVNHRDATSMVDHVSRELGSLRATVTDTLEHLTERIDGINERSAERPESSHHFKQELAQMRHMLLASEKTTEVQDRIELTDLIRGALPTDRYEFNTPLSNGYIADCCVTPSAGGLSFPIDAQFPIGAYTHYKRETAEQGKGTHARNEFRRAILSHILELHQRLIIPNETTSSALLFAPSDSIINDLHANFPDLIQDSYHAHIWIVSPASVLATLHTLTAVMAQTKATPPTPIATQSNDEILAEIESLRQRFIDDETSEEAPVAEPEANFELPEEEPTPTTEASESQKPTFPDEPEVSTTSEDEEPAGFEQPAQNPFKAFERSSYNSGDLHTDYNSIAEEENAIERLTLIDDEVTPSKERTPKAKRPPFPLR